MVLTIASLTASMLNLSWAEMGMTGDLPATVSTDELEDGLVVLLSSLLSHQVDLVLQNDNLIELHNFDGSQMFGCLRLRARFIAGNEQKGSVHDGGTRQHSTHENVVTGAVHESRF